MVVSHVKRFVGPYGRNLGGWRTRRKLVVIESDDWGSIRMPSRSVYERCLAAGYPVDRTAYERYDSLLSQDDLDALFSLLASYADAHGNHPVLTANVITANPDFDAIAADDFERYHYESITETFQRYPRHQHCLDLWSEGQHRGVFYPQFHGREHLNVHLFMTALQTGDPTARFAFDHRMPGCIPPGAERGRNAFVEATRFRSEDEKQCVKQAHVEGLAQFESLFGFRSRTLIPTNYRWSSDFDEAVSRCGVEGFQGAPVMKEQQANGTNRRIRRRLGETNSVGQTYLVRNATFEPSQSDAPRDRAVDRCLREIRIAFRMQKPAIISSHRVNYCGFIDESNRDQNLAALRRLFDTVLRTWKDVEFVNSAQLLDVIKQNRLASPSTDQ
jgi:hypothetical protein